MNKRMYSCLLATSLFFAGVQTIANAQLSEDESPEKQSQESEPEKSDSKSKQSGQNNRNEKVFKPSEEISEDISVDFPVDI